ncbi:ABC transporter ATP-binding protein [Lentisphaera profundi]|uniref:ABC transporter ATP-binding protein n=1 Tax=Lentisphaera profundi TaxID=1658616 RepID=A0ABY7VWA3_9BACT|nr:ABC transporter ATP-binding protein [Lentisphaera profundi]WDE98191.1 ABC transporter ATP-binding protein [Lentisphaera profundi]
MNNIIKALKFLNKILNRKDKKNAMLVALAMLINVLSDLLSLALVLPVINLVLTDDFLQKNDSVKYLYDFFGFWQEKTFIIATCLSLFIIFLIKNLLSLWIARFQIKHIQNFVNNNALQLLEIYFRKGLNYIKNNNSNKLIFNIYAGSQRLGNNVLLSLINLGNECLIILLITISIALYDIKIVMLLALLITPFFLIFYRKTKHKISALGYSLNKETPKLNEYLFQTFHGYCDTVVSDTFPYQKQRITDKLNTLKDIQTKSFLYRLCPTKIIETCLILSISTIVIYGIYFIDSKEQLITLIGIFFLAAYRTMPSINRIMIALMSLNENLFLLDTLKDLNQKASHEEKPSTVKFTSSLKLENISYAFPDKPHDFIFENFDLEIKKGETVGIIGSSGSGKTTLMNILLGFYPLSKGHYLIDEQDIENFNKNSFYGKVGYVQQNVYLTDSSIASNVAYGQNENDFDRDKIKHCLEQAQLTEFHLTQEQGIDSLIGENGVKISGGQRQRIGIARALYYDAEILFFDEATSALDSQTEDEITKAIESLSKTNLTIIIIAHRISTLKHTDYIIELNNGRIQKTLEQK